MTSGTGTSTSGFTQLCTQRTHFSITSLIKGLTSRFHLQQTGGRVRLLASSMVFSSAMALGISTPAPTVGPTGFPATATATPQDGNSDSDGLLDSAPPATPTESLSDAPPDSALDDEPDIPCTALAEASTQDSIALHTSATAELGNVIHVRNVAPNKTVYAQYGVWRHKFTSTADYQHHTRRLTSNHVTGHGSMHAGWYTWDE
ncbi:hypothetical protein ACFV5G_30855 [Streptomyces sp. NPDC059766]|uniref:hypothetical protein n=1 Tax=Streptomyces sp. NPDC059766 TaxID=3346940 RepID=UPI00366A5369